MSVVPANVTNALNTVHGDRDALTTAQTALTAAKSTLAAAQSAVGTAESNVSAAQSQLDQDYQALLALLAQTYKPVPSSLPTASPPPKRS